MGRPGGSPGVGSGGRSRARWLRRAWLCHRQQPGAAGPGRRWGLCGPAAQEFRLALGQGRGVAVEARASPVEQGWQLHRTTHAMATSRDPPALPGQGHHTHH